MGFAARHSQVATPDAVIRGYSLRPGEVPGISERVVRQSVGQGRQSSIVVKTGQRSGQAEGK